MSNRIIGFILLMLSFSGGWLWMDYQQALTMPVIVNPVLIEIEKGDSFHQITEKLLAQKLAIKPIWFKVIAFTKNASTKIKTGEYELTSGLSIPEILDVFVLGKTKKYSITFPEGWSFKEIRQEIDRSPNLQHTLSGLSQEAVWHEMSKDKNDAGNILDDNVIGPEIPKVIPPDNRQLPEGLFFPDTYFYEKHTSDMSLLKRAFDKMQQILRQEWLNRAEGLPVKTPYEALILASIVEKETGEKSERPQIAGVFERRLQQGMMLQTDPTIIYGMGDSYQGDIKTKDLTTATPYNTYMNFGLPPTPIAMPGRDAIHAVLHPVDGNSLYFVAKGDGTHVFSATLQEHNAAVDKFQRKKK
ncbi:MAG: endolytic transglycosylase MltG [Methylococcaceae bacterium]|nr:endolytic transglycosylase MltG [Methylococcaceae bacterium]